MVINIKEVVQKDNTVFDLNANDKTTLVVDSEYNRIIIGDTIANGKPARFMNMALGFQSATYTDEADRYEMVFDYIKGFDQTVDLGTHRTNMLMIGGAAYQYPKYVLAHRQDSTMDVVEIDEKVTELAKEYFYLQDCIDQYDPDHNRLGLYTQDAKIYINECQKKYDIIFNDAFSGTVPPRTLTTLETIQKIAETLNEDGIYVINIVQETSNLEFLKAECHTLSVEFPYIYVKQLTPSNYRVIASFKPLNTENMDLDYSESILLTDNYCPIESLISMPDVEIEDENDDK
jgi:spermidine synthase